MVPRGCDISSDIKVCKALVIKGYLIEKGYSDVSTSGDTIWVKGLGLCVKLAEAGILVG